MAFALAWIGSPFLLMFIVTTAASDEPEARCTDTTSPTSTPAIRTGDGMCSCVWEVNIAFSTNCLPLNGHEPPNT